VLAAELKIAGGTPAATEEAPRLAFFRPNGNSLARQARLFLTSPPRAMIVRGIEGWKILNSVKRKDELNCSERHGPYLSAVPATIGLRLSTLWEKPEGGRNLSMLSDRAVILSIFSHHDKPDLGVSYLA
jgi:hypothetical protein